MSFTRFPNTPLTEMPPLKTQTRSEHLPAHPLLHQLRPSRTCQDNTENEDDFVPDLLNDYRNSLAQLLNSERWAHHRTMQTLHNEIARREQVEQQHAMLGNEYGNLANGWSSLNRAFLQCNSERLDLIRQVATLHAELEHTRMFANAPDTSSPKSAMRLDMTSATHRRLAIRARRRSRLGHVAQSEHSQPLTDTTSSIYEDDTTIAPLFSRATKSAEL